MIKICKTWFHGILTDYALRRKLRKLQIKEFGIAGSGKTRLIRTMVVSLRITLQSLRSLEELADMERLCEVLQNIGLDGVASELLSENKQRMAGKNQLDGERVVCLWKRLVHFGQTAKIRLTAYTGVASSLLGFGARTVCSMFKTGTTKFKEDIDGPLAIQLQSSDGLGFAILLVADEISFIRTSLLGKMALRGQQ